MKSTKTIGAGVAGLALLAGAGVQVAAAASPSCAVLDDAIHQVVNPAVGSSLLTPWASEVTKAAKHGFTEKRGTAFYASTEPAPGLVGVHRLYLAKKQDFLFTTDPAEVSSAVSRFGYVDQGIGFYVSPRADAAGGCDSSVARMVKRSKHRMVLSASGESGKLAAAGWKSEGTRFHAASKAAAPADRGKPGPTTPPVSNPPVSKPPAGSTFSFAVIPDTQVEVLRADDTRLKNRNQWLVKQKVAFALHTGDLVNWDTPAHEQYIRAADAMDVLTANGIPYTLAIGNHDTMATKAGGSARPGNTRLLVRDTTTMNDNISLADLGSVGGAFEPGKIDNVYSTYQAGGKKFLVIALEFCPRKSAVEWARKVVASHPDHNVIINTHSYLTKTGVINPSNEGYGDSSGTYLYNRVVSQFPNVKMVFSGHTGSATKGRVDTGVKGNKIYSFLTTFHEEKHNPVRLLKVDTAKGTVTSTIYAPSSAKTWPAYDQTISVDFV